MVRAVDVPVTVKMRRGLTPSTSDPAETARRFEARGRRRALLAPAGRGRGVRGHGRPPHHRRGRRGRRRPGRSRAATSPRRSEARRVLEDTGCAAIAVGRAAPRQPLGVRRDPRGRRATAPRPSTRWSTRSPSSPPTRASPSASPRGCGYMRKFYPWYLAGHELPAVRARGASHDAELDGALARLRALAAASAAA